MSPGSLSFAKLVMMSSAPAKSAGDATDTRPKIHLFNQRCPIYSRLQSVLGVRSFCVEHNKSIVHHHSDMKTRPDFHVIQRINRSVSSR